MKLIEPTVKVVSEPNILKKIEYCGRVCYNSYEKTTETSALPFVTGLILNGHTSVLEHVVVQNHDKVEIDPILNSFIETVLQNYGFISRETSNNYNMINVRDLLYKNIIAPAMYAGNFILNKDSIDTFLQELQDESQCYNDFITFEIVCSRAVSHEIVRHRSLSFSQESQRYCKYNKEVGVLFIKPQHDDIVFNDSFKKACRDSEKAYLKALARGIKPEFARYALNNATSTKILVSGYKKYIQKFIGMRTTNGVFPEMKQIATLMKQLI